MKNNVFAFSMMMLFPISFAIAVIVLQPSKFSSFILALLAAYLFWFIIHSLILMICFTIFKRDG